MALLKNYTNKRVSETGSALVYILIAIALLAALTASFMKPASQQTTAQNSFKTVSSLKSQIDFIRSAIQECVLKYPSGEPDLVGSVNFPYPINPSSSTYFNAVVTPSADDRVEFIRCPGNPGNSHDHSSIFGGSSGKFLPPAPDLFGPWFYYNGVDGIFFYSQTDKTDEFLQTAMEKLDENFAECEADVIDASGGTIELTSTAAGSDPKCVNNSSGSTCFRVWVIARPSNVYNGDAGDEVGCP